MGWVMASIPKSTALAHQNNVSGPKVLPSTRVSSTHETSVDLMEGSSSISFDNSAFEYRENADASFGQKNNNQHLPYRPVFTDTPTQVFESMLQGMEIPKALSDNNQSEAVYSVPYVGLLAKAIEIYENNARTFNGEISMRGTSFSMVL